MRHFWFVVLILAALLPDNALAQRRMVFAANIDAQSIVSVTVKDPEMGEVRVEQTGKRFVGGQYKIGSQLDVVAVPNPNYIFVEWTVNGVRVGTDPHYKLSVDQKEHAMVATFTEKYVDLGLPSGAMWATMNLGANRYDEFGDYYAFGELTTKENFDLRTYTYPTISGGQISDDQDAALAQWQGQWRIPTREQWQELIDNCTWTWITLGGVPGYRGVSMLKPNAAIFLPATGEKDGSRYSDANGSYYMTANAYEWDSEHCYEACFTQDEGIDVEGNQLYIGVQIRPVFVEK